MSRPIHARRAASVQAVMADVVTRMALPALAWAVASGPPRDRHVTVHAPGACPPDALWRISSVTKLLGTATALSLVEEGVLGLDDPVERWVPRWANRRVLVEPTAGLGDTVPARRPTTVRDLLTMGFGLGYDFSATEDTPLSRAAHAAGLMSDWRTPGLDPAAWADRAADLPMAHQPGEGWLYQSSFDALAVVVQAATGQGFDEVLRARLLTPLGMADTGFTVGPEQLSRVPAHGFPDESGGFAEEHPAADPALVDRPAFCSASTGLVSTARDLVVFAQMLLDDGRGPDGPVLSEASVRAMRSDALSGPARTMAAGAVGPGGSWGLGAGIDAAGRFGWDGGTGASLWVDPRTQVAGVLVSGQGMGPPSVPEYLKRFWGEVRREPWT